MFHVNDSKDAERCSACGFVIVCCAYFAVACLLLWLVKCTCLDMAFDQLVYVRSTSMAHTVR